MLFIQVQFAKRSLNIRNPVLDRVCFLNWRSTKWRSIGEITMGNLQEGKTWNNLPTFTISTILSSTIIPTIIPQICNNIWKNKKGTTKQGQPSLCCYSAFPHFQKLFPHPPCFSQEATSIDLSASYTKSPSPHPLHSSRSLYLFQDGWMEERTWGRYGREFGEVRKRGRR